MFEKVQNTIRETTINPNHNSPSYHCSHAIASRFQTNKPVKIVIGVENILNLEHVTKHQTHIVFHGQGSQQRNKLIELLIRRIRIPRGNRNSIIHVEGEGIEGIIENDHLRLHSIKTTINQSTKSRFRDRRSLMYIPSFTRTQCSRFKQYWINFVSLLNKSQINSP